MGEFSVTVVDVLVVLVILVSAAYAIYRGLMRETLSIFAWVAAAFVTLRFFPNFRPLLRDLVSPNWLADLLVFAAMFLIVLVPLSFMSYRFGESVKRSEVGPVDRTLGLVFGVGRGLVIVGFAYVAFISMAERHP
jgi:membrane protein required for colicin V production